MDVDISLSRRQSITCHLKRDVCRDLLLKNTIQKGKRNRKSVSERLDTHHFHQLGDQGEY
jgi:hypothetical protein